MAGLIMKICIVSALFPAITVSAENDSKPYSYLIALCGICLMALAIMTIAFISYVRKMKIQSRKSKLVDEETGIGNRAFFINRFNNDISVFSGTDYYIAYFVVDSNFLQIYHSEISFEEVVKFVARTISESVGNYEFAARVTESGFALALRCDSDETAEKRVREILGKCISFAGIKKKTHQGLFNVALYNLDENDDNCEMILFNLRRNCTNILGEGEELIFCSKHNMNNVFEEKELSERIKLGLEREEFKLFVQFIVDNEKMQIVSAEALSRWDTPEKGILTPAKYIGAMSRFGMIVGFDYYMFEQVCKQLELWKDTELSGISISCNFSRITLSEKDFVERITGIAGKYNFNKEHLILEITEEAIEANREKAMKNVTECKNMGFKFALDDLGSGYTSLINLCEYPIDVVKIDREILLRTDKKNGQNLFSGIVALAHKLSLKVVCEGVESKAQQDFVTSTKCDYTQGWYFSKAIPVSDAKDFVDGFQE